MKRLLAFLVFVVMPLAMMKAQFGGEQAFWSTASASSELNPQTLAASNWWVNTDLPTNGYQMPDVVSGCWTDRIGGVLMTNNLTGGAPHATNYNFGVYLQQGCAGMDVTNPAADPVSVQANCTTLYIYRPVIASDFDVLAWDISTGGGFRMRRFTAGSWRAGIVGTEATCFADPDVNKYYDVIVVRTNGNSITIYTNGIVTAYNNVTLGNTTRPTRLGAGTTANTGLEGYIAEAAYFWTNATASGISNIHYYATNKYKHTP